MSLAQGNNTPTRPRIEPEIGLDGIGWDGRWGGMVLDRRWDGMRWDGIGDGDGRWAGGWD